MKMVADMEIYMEKVAKQKLDSLRDLNLYNKTKYKSGIN